MDNSYNSPNSGNNHPPDPPDDPGEPFQPDEPEEPDDWDDRMDQLERVGLYRNRRGLDALNPDYLEALADEAEAASWEPVDYVLNLFNRHQLVFVGIGPITKATGEFLNRLISRLPEVGVDLIGLEFACIDDQPLLEVGIESPEFRFGGSCAAIIRWALRTGMGFVELVNLLQAAWLSNRDGPPVRLYGLEYDLNFEAVTDSADLRNPNAWPHLRDKGSAARHMRDVLENEVLSVGAKALVITRTQHALTRLRRTPHPLWDAYDVELVDGKVVGAANHLYGSVGDRVATVLIHQPLPGLAKWGDWARPADGVLDALVSMNDGIRGPVAFDTSGGWLGELACSTSIDDGILSDWANGWVYLERDDQVQAPSPLAGVLDDEALELARRSCIDPQLRRTDVTLADIDRAFGAAATAAELVWTQVL